MPYFFPIKLRPRIINFRLQAKLSTRLKLIKITDETIGTGFLRETRLLGQGKETLLGWVRLLKVSLDWPWHDNVSVRREKEWERGPFPPGANQRRTSAKTRIYDQEAVQKRRPWLETRATPQLLRGFQAAPGTIFLFCFCFLFFFVGVLSVFLNWI